MGDFLTSNWKEIVILVLAFLYIDKKNESIYKEDVYKLEKERSEYIQKATESYEIAQNYKRKYESSKSRFFVYKSKIDSILAVPFKTETVKGKSYEQKIGLIRSVLVDSL